MVVENGERQTKRGVGLWRAHREKTSCGLRLVPNSAGLGPLILFQLLQVFSKLPNKFKHANYEKGTFRVPKISKLGMSVDIFN
jgi:hypothetical protein